MMDSEDSSLNTSLAAATLALQGGRSRASDEADAVREAAGSADERRRAAEDSYYKKSAGMYCLPSTTVCPQPLFALNHCSPSTTVCPQPLFALNHCSPSANCPLPACRKLGQRPRPRQKHRRAGNA